MSVAKDDLFLLDNLAEGRSDPRPIQDIDLVGKIGGAEQVPEGSQRPEIQRVVSDDGPIEVRCVLRRALDAGAEGPHLPDGNHLLQDFPDKEQRVRTNVEGPS